MQILNVDFMLGIWAAISIGALIWRIGKNLNVFLIIVSVIILFYSVELQITCAIYFPWGNFIMNKIGLLQIQ